MREFACLALMVCCALGEDLSGLVRQLGDEDAARRDTAERELLGKGVKELDALRKELESAADPEIRGRLAAVIRRLETEKDRAQFWATGPEDQLAAFLKGASCGCGNAKPWTPVEIVHETLAELFPRARFFVLDWTCCQDKPVRSRLVAVCREPDEVVEIEGMHAWKSFAPWCAEAKTPERAARVAGCLAGLSYSVAWAPPFAFRIDEGTTKADAKGLTVTVMARGVAVRFDAEGRLEWGSVLRRR